jgi:hypothetical protein
MPSPCVGVRLAEANAEKQNAGGDEDAAPSSDGSRLSDDVTVKVVTRAREKLRCHLGANREGWAGLFLGRTVSFHICTVPYRADMLRSWNEYERKAGK